MFHHQGQRSGDVGVGGFLLLFAGGAAEFEPEVGRIGLEHESAGGNLGRHRLQLRGAALEYVARETDEVAEGHITLRIRRECHRVHSVHYIRYKKSTSELVDGSGEAVDECRGTREVFHHRDEVFVGESTVEIKRFVKLIRQLHLQPRQVRDHS